MGRHFFLISLLLALLVSVHAADEATVRQCLKGLAALTSLQDRQRQVQSPDAVKAVADSFGVDAATYIAPAESGQPTGDFVRLLRTGDGRLSIFFGDVEGHGPEAALTGMKLHEYLDTPPFRAALDAKRGAADVLVHIDENLELHDRLVTMSHTLIDPATGRIEFASAGFPALRVYSRDGSLTKLLAGGFYLGTEGFSYRQAYDPAETHVYSNGDVLLLVTDGVLDGLPRRLRPIIETLDKDVAAMVRSGASVEEIKQFVVNAVESTHDDMTVLVLQLPPRR